METNWRNVIKDPQEEKIFGALEDDRYDWRTVRALARESNLTEDEVGKILADHPVLVRKSSVPSGNGEDLFTLQSRFFKKKGFGIFTTSGTTPST